jgi:hypothetical protein
MQQEKAVKRMMLDIKCNERIPFLLKIDDETVEDNYLSKLYLAEMYSIFKYYLEMMYAVGWEQGRKSEFGHGSKPIGQYDKRGILVNTYGSQKEAAKRTNFTEDGIHKAMLRGTPTKQGWLWKYL